MPVVGAAAAQHVDLRRVLHEATILIAEFVGVAVIEIGGVVQLRVASTEGVGAQSADALPPTRVRVHRLLWVGWAQLIM